jgi:SAM-dependent methyltransferase
MLLAEGYHVIWATPPHGTTAEYVSPAVKAPTLRLVGEWLPFADETFDAVILHETLEFMVDDRRGVEEAARVLKPGGWFIARIPGSGPLAWLDAFNLYRYVNETLLPGDPLPETQAMGWRRHYGPRDIQAISAQAPLINLRHQPSGGWLTDATYAAALIITSLVRSDPERARQVRRAYARFGDLEEHLPFGRYQILTAHQGPKA